MWLEVSGVQFTSRLEDTILQWAFSPLWLLQSLCPSFVVVSFDLGVALYMYVSVGVSCSSVPLKFCVQSVWCLLQVLGGKGSTNSLYFSGSHLEAP